MNDFTNHYDNNHSDRRFRPLKLIGRLAGLMLILAVAAGAFMYVSNTGIRQTVQGVMAGVHPRHAFGADAVTLLVLGKDEDRNNRKQVMDTNGRSDTIILARLDFRANTIRLLSIPRDTRVRVPGVRGYRKINSAHAIGGPDLTVETIENFLGVHADRTLVVDYGLLQQVIDALGGVRVNVDKQLDYDDNWGNLHIHLKPGWQVLNGREAMGFARFRHANHGSGDSDFVRIGRQQMLLQGVKARLQEPAAWIRIPAVLEVVRTEMKGSLTYPQLVALAQFARSVPRQNIQSYTLPARPGRSFVYPDREEALALVARIFPMRTARHAEVRDADTGRERPSRRRTRRIVRQTAPVPKPQVVAPVEPEPVVEEPVEMEPIEPSAPEPAAETVQTPEPGPEPVVPAEPEVPSEPAAG